jgi:ribosomal protein L6P/L9E
MEVGNTQKQNNTYSGALHAHIKNMKINVISYFKSGCYTLSIIYLEFLYFT